MSDSRRLRLKGILIFAVAAFSGLFALVPHSHAQSKAKSRAAERKSASAVASPAEVEKAELAIARKDYAAAEPMLVLATRINPQDFRAWYDLGYVFSQTNRSGQAIDVFRRAIAINESIAETQTALGRLLLSLGRNEDAVPYLRKAAELKPGVQAWLDLGVAQEKDHPTEALASIVNAIRADPSNSEAHLRAAMIHERKKDWQSAEREYLAARMIAPSSEALAGLANIYQQTGRGDQAETVLQEYLRLKPNDAKAHLQYGRLQAKKGNREEAVREFDAAVSKAVTDSTVLKQAAEELAALAEYQRAAEIYLRLLRQSPKEADLHFRLGAALFGSSNFPSAEQEFISALELDPRIVEAYGSLAISASKNNHHQLAIKALDARAKFTSESPATYFLRATSYDHLKQFPLASENYRLFLEAAKGAYPDEEWKARHRLIAIEPEGAKKKR